MRDLAAPNRRDVRGEMGGMLISGHSGQDAPYGRPRKDVPNVREARRAAKPGARTGRPPDGPHPRFKGFTSVLNTSPDAGLHPYGSFLFRIAGFTSAWPQFGKAILVELRRGVVVVKL